MAMSDDPRNDDLEHGGRDKRTLPYRIAYGARSRPDARCSTSAMQSDYWRASWCVTDVLGTPTGVWRVRNRQIGDSFTAFAPIYASDLWHHLRLIREESTDTARELATDGILLAAFEMIEFSALCIRAENGIRRVLAYLDVLARDIENEWAHDALMPVRHVTPHDDVYADTYPPHGTPWLSAPK